MAGWDPMSWPLHVWVLYAVGALYLVGFVTFFFRIERAAQRAASGRREDVERYNRILRGVPNALYARMLGRKPLSADEADAGSTR